MGGVDDLAYLGGVTYVAPGEDEDCVGVGLRPSNDRCVGVRVISVRSSLDFKAGRRARTMLYRNKQLMRRPV